MIKMKRIKGVTAYSNSTENKDLLICCSKKEGELFRHIVNAIFDYKRNLDEFHKACEEGKMFVTTTDGTLLQGLYSDSLEKAISENNYWYKCGVVTRYDGESITSFLKGKSSYCISGRLFNPFYEEYNITHEENGVNVFEELPGVREILKTILDNNIVAIKNFIGYSNCNPRIATTWED